MQLVKYCGINMLLILKNLVNKNSPHFLSVFSYCCYLVYINSLTTSDENS